MRIACSAASVNRLYASIAIRKCRRKAAEPALARTCAPEKIAGNTAETAAARRAELEARLAEVRSELAKLPPAEPLDELGPCFRGDAGEIVGELANTAQVRGVEQQAGEGGVHLRVVMAFE